MQNNKMICSIYRSGQKDEMYLYVSKQTGLAKVPATLSTLFGKPQHVMDMLLTDKKNLARAKACDVLAAIKEQGFYLQMPPKKDDSMLDLYQASVNPTD